MKKKTASQRGRSSIRKGKAYERWVAKELRPIWPEARRGIGQARAAGEVPDVDGTPYWIEAKNHKHVAIRAALEQGVDAAYSDNPEEHRPVIVVSRDFGKPDLVTMYLDDFKRLMRASMVSDTGLVAKLVAIHAALQEAGECHVCGGSGRLVKDCTLCGDSTTLDHECNDRVTECYQCHGAKLHPAALAALGKGAT